MYRNIRCYLKHGMSLSDYYNTDLAIAKFALKRIKVYRKARAGYPSSLTPEKWDEMLDDMIYFLEKKIAFEIYFDEDERANRGYKYFADYWCSMWI